ncbi:salicylaldehyde dehydrogenase [Mycena rosella]|uniref:Salicylaldehyde dehydrogenase n=1 Tax=Mycena rosella TaxID=1033263 RepID=A0AAD7G903_MYCRO|nr:salicylaldehyde dehydrogenase [Mycena rosella]
MYTIPLLINGQYKTSTTTFPVESPVSHTTLWSCSSASSADVDAALAAASAAFPIWSKTKPAVRRTILLKAADLLEERAEELKDHMNQETGSVGPFADFNVSLAVEAIRDVAGRCSAIMGSIPTCQEEGTSALILKEPFGVVLGIAAWNAPYPLGIRACLFPIAAGNTCILKGSELSPRCFEHIGRLFTDAGLPAGVNFTGSSAVGALIAAAAGRALKPCLMELGGKASAIVLDDADLELAAMQCTLGAFMHSGQICMSTERILVHAAVVDKFRPALQKAVAGFLPAGGPAPVLVQGPAVFRNRALVADALSKGATLLTGDPEADEPHPETGAPSATRLRPLVVDGVTPAMALYRDESFGPSVSIITVADDDEAVAIANDTEYGLSAAVFTKDLGRGLRVARRIESGAVHINSNSVHDEAMLPHGGAKSSGWGRFNAQWGIEEFLRIKTVTFQE